jgi:hypothetical protein
VNLRTRLKLLFILLSLTIPLYAAMSDASALKAAKIRWGSVAMIGQKRDMMQSNWTKLVGYASPMCVAEFTAVGSGFNTWDAAFADADMHPPKVGGPYKGHVSITLNAYDAVAISTVQVYIDGQAPMAVKTFPPSPPTQVAAVSWDFDTTTIADGFHVLCAQGTNPAGLIGKTYSGYLFIVNQATGQESGVLGMPGSTQPGVDHDDSPIAQK